MSEASIIKAFPISSESRNDIIVSSSKKRGIFYEKETKQTSQRHTRKTCYPR